MQPSADPRALQQAGIAALQAGDARTARAHFEQILATGKADASVCVALALACQSLRDEAAMVSAIDRALAVDSRNLHALIMKGDHLAASGNTRAATQYYGLAVALAAQARNLPPGLAQSVRLAEAARDRINAHIEAHLRAQLAAAGYDERRASPRFTLSLELLSGKKRPYVQEPRAYYFPELPNIQFYPREMFPWLERVEAATDDIRAELEEILKEDGAFAPYLQTPVGAPARPDMQLLNSLDWSAFFLWKDGAVVAQNAARCPRTMAALEGAPLSVIPNRTPSILFSLLKPGAHISAHTGYLNSRLICHLPLIVPAGCRFRVGNDVREWREGKAWVFDDTIEHEAWNASKETRVVLIFDIWRPELTAEERSLVATLLAAVDTYPGGEPSRWTD